jgi:hypothetical protein
MMASKSLVIQKKQAYFRFNLQRATFLFTGSNAELSMLPSRAEGPISHIAA